MTAQYAVGLVSADCRRAAEDVGHVYEFNRSSNDCDGKCFAFEGFAHTRARIPYNGEPAILIWSNPPGANKVCAAIESLGLNMLLFS